MSSKEFYEAVVKMRVAQATYTRTGRANDAKAAKALEIAVDTEIHRVHNYIHGIDNPQIFN